MAPFSLSDFPGRDGVSADFLEAFFLFLLADVQPELDDHLPAVRQLPLEVEDVVVGLIQLAAGDRPLDPFDEHAAVPRPVEDADLAGRRHARAKSPHPGVKAFDFGRGVDRAHRKAARIERLGHAIDQAALARRVPAFKDNEDWNFGGASSALARGKTELQFRVGPLVDLLVDAFSEIDQFKHRQAPQKRPVSIRAGLVLSFWLEKAATFRPA